MGHIPPSQNSAPAADLLRNLRGKKALQALENKARMIKNGTKHIKKTKGV